MEKGSKGRVSWNIPDTMKAMKKLRFYFESMWPEKTLSSNLLSNLYVPTSQRWQGGCLDPDKSVDAVCRVDYTSQNQISSISKASIGAR